MKQKFPSAASDSISLKNQPFEFLECARQKLIDKLSSEMRRNQTGLGLKESVPDLGFDEKDETLVQWVTMDGLDAIKFKCLIFTNQEPLMETMIYAIPARDSEGFFMDKFVTFKVFKVEPVNKSEELIDRFER